MIIYFFTGIKLNKMKWQVLRKLRDMTTMLLIYVPTIQRVKLSPSVGLIFNFRRFRKEKKSSIMTGQSICKCGKDFLCQSNCKGFALWMSGMKCHPTSKSVFLRTSKKSLTVGVTVFGSTTMVSLSILQGDTI